MQPDFTEEMKRRAMACRSRIGIGISTPDPNLVESLSNAKDYAKLVVVGPKDMDLPSGIELIESLNPASDLVDLLAKGEIDGAVRGNVSASKAMRAIHNRFSIDVLRMVLLQLPGWAFFLSPVGIDEGDTVSQKLELALRGASFIRRFGVEPKVSFLSGGRLEDIGRSERIDKSLGEGELLARLAMDCGINANHPGILIEECRGGDLIIAPDGICGNLLFRTFMLLCNAQSMGAPVLMDDVFIDSSRTRGEFTGPIILASALAKMRI